MNKTYFEITRQYQALAKTIDCLDRQKAALNQLYAEKKPKSIIFIGSGSSYYLAQSAEIIARTQFGFSAFSMTAGDAMVNFKSYKNAFDGALAVAISRSGNTTEIIKTITAMRNEFGTAVVGLTCVEDSELRRISDVFISMPWAFDESVCQTGTVTNLYAASALISAAFAGDSRISDNLKKMTGVGDAYISKYDEEFKKIALRHWNKAVVLADGEISGLAAEGALAFKEICCTLSNYYHVLDVRHGPMVLVDQDTLVIADLKSENKEYQIGLVQDLLKKDATVVICTDNTFGTIDGVALQVTHPDFGGIAEGLPFINVAQLIAYHRAIDKGVDPGNPEGLDAWINLA